MRFGLPELLLLLAMFLTFGVPLGIIVLVVWLVRRKDKAKGDSASPPTQGS